MYHTVEVLLHFFLLYMATVVSLNWALTAVCYLPICLPLTIISLPPIYLCCHFVTSAAVNHLGIKRLRYDGLLFACRPIEPDL